MGGGEQERDRQIDIDLLFHLRMHSLVAFCMCPDQVSNPQAWPIGMTLHPTELPVQGFKASCVCVCVCVDILFSFPEHDS